MINLVKFALSKGLSDHSLNKEDPSNIIDIPWLFKNEKGVYRLIFKKGGRLIVSLNGHVNIESWEHHKTSKSLVFSINGMLWLATIKFIDQRLLIVQKDGKDGLLVMRNDNQLAEENTVNHVINILSKSIDIETETTIDNQHLLFIASSKAERSTNFQVLDLSTMIPISDGVYRTQETFYQIKNGYQINWFDLDASFELTSKDGNRYYVIGSNLNVKDVRYLNSDQIFTEADKTLILDSDKNICQGFQSLITDQFYINIKDGLVEDFKLCHNVEVNELDTELTFLVKESGHLSVGDRLLFPKEGIPDGFYVTMSFLSRNIEIKNNKVIDKRWWV